MVACAWGSVAAAFVALQPAGGVALGGMMFVGPLIAMRFQRRADIAWHVAGATTAFLVVAASGPLVGAVTVATSLAAATSAWVTQVQVFACTQILEAIERQGHELEQLVRRDATTGAGNRRLFDEQLHALLAVRATSRRPLALVIFDLGMPADHDRATALTNEEALRASAAAVERLLPAQSVFARLDGDEFAVLADGAVDEAERTINAVRAGLASARLAVGSPPLDAAFGTAIWPTDATGPETLVAHADAHLRTARAGSPPAGAGGDARSRQPRR